MVPEKLSIGLPSMKRPPNVADEVVASLHVSCIFPSRLFARHGSFRNVATAQVLLNVALAGTPTRHSSQVAFPMSWNVQQRRSIWLQPGRRRGCRCPRQCRFAGETEFRHRTIAAGSSL
jgi:hypothetical protein